MRQLYRVTLFVRPDYVESARTTSGQKGFLEGVRRRASALGFSPSLLETQDPTDGRIVILLAQRTGSIGEHDDVIRVLKVEPVEEPPAGTEKADVRSHAFDPGLSVAEVEMIQHALKSEHNPRHLWGLASSLEPSFPIAASLLRARKVAVESNTPPPVVDAPRPDPALAILRRRAVDVEAMRCGLPADVVDEDVRRASFQEAVGDTEAETPQVLRNLARAVLHPVARGVAIVDKTALLAACPISGREGVVSPPAIRLALATCKPEMSGVRSFAGAGERRDALKEPPRGADPTDTVQARVAMVRAQKAIELHRWLRWYEQKRKTG